MAVRLPAECEKCKAFDFSCNCDRMQVMKWYNQHKNDYRPPVISTEHALVCVEMMSSIPFFPSDAAARSLIADEVACMAASNEQAVWLARRMARLYSRWPGIQEMRRVFWATHRPLDGVNAIGTSEEYGSYFPKEIGQPESAMVSAYEREYVNQIEAPKS